MLRPAAVAPSALVMRPASAAFNKPGRTASFLLIVTVPMGGRHFYRTVTHDISIEHQQMA
jgi:hypothetical protein